MSDYISKGEWIPKERTTECSIDIDVVCSKCGYVGIEGYAHGYELNEINIQEVRDYTKKLDMNFCTCCGAKMRGGEWMKLIIDIPKVDYMRIIKYQNVSGCGNMLTNAIGHGTPLDDVKPESEEKKFLCEWNIRAEIEAKSEIEAKRTFAEKISNDFFTYVYPEDVKIVRGEEP